MMALIKPDAENRIDPLEVETIARKLAVAFVAAVESEGKERGRGPIKHARWDRDELMKAAPDSIKWYEIGYAEQDRPGAASEILARIRELARKELESGGRAGEVVAGELGPWAWARFMELRASMIEEYQPQGSIQARMVEALAQSWTAYELWMGFEHHLAAVLFEGDQIYGAVLERLERIAAMADRFMRMFLRVQRHLLAIRRYPMPVLINNPKQVNIAAGGGQQTNVVKNTKKRGTKARGTATSGARRLKAVK